MLVIGTESAPITPRAFRSSTGSSAVWTAAASPFVMDKHDVTFGCKEKLERAAQELVEEYAPEAVFLRDDLRALK